jgi:hypothetical protein
MNVISKNILNPLIQPTLIIGFLFMAHQPIPAYDPPADPNATADVKKVLAYLGHIADQDKVLSGQFRHHYHATGNCVGIFEQTGKWPAILEHYFYCQGADNSDAENEKRRQLFLDYWNEGGLISIWAKLIVRHSGVKEEPGPWSDIWQTGTPKNNKLLAHFETYYVPHMKWLQEKGVVLIFKPYNEELEYFKEIEDEDMKKLWIWTFEYFTQTQGLHNLIWFCAANSGGEKFEDRYPGDAYVDMIGFSDYVTDKSATNPRIASYNTMTQNHPNKVFAVAEEGWTDTGQPEPNTQDAREIIALIKNHMPKSAYWLSWSGGWSPAMQKHSRELYNDPWVIDRSEVNWKDTPE